MSTETILFITAGAVAGGFVNGLAGFGTALFALCFFLAVLPPTQSVALVLILSIITGVQGLWVVRRAVLNNPKRLMRFLLPALLGIPLGIQCLKFVDVPILKLLIATFLLIYGSFFFIRRDLPSFTNQTPYIDTTVGFMGGILGGLASLSGALPTMWCSLRLWPKAETRGILQPYNVIVLGVSATLLAFNGVYTVQIIQLALFAVPVALLSAQIGLMVYKRVTNAQFQRLLIVLCFVSGAILMLRELL